jgi:decaprenylphospho-beta-D-ribofuranose 2-oxidase
VLLRTRLASFDGTEGVDGEFCRPDRYRHLFAALAAPGPAIARGAGLSYCAASAGSGVRSVSALPFNRVLAFDGQRGTVTVEAGIRLGDLFRFTTPRGWVLPIMPGHPCITVGGCVGCNVHGKNHYHEGNFVNVVEAFTLFHPDHGELTCSRSQRPALFELTVGGFGLTGFLTSVTLRLRRLAGSAVRLRRQRCADLVEAVELLDREREADVLYSWHNFNRRGGGFGAGFVYAGHYLDEERAGAFRCRTLTSEGRGRWRVGPLAGWMTRTAARVYGWSQRLARAEKVQDLASATFPINGKEVYFRLFGRGGFREYQVLVPRDRWRQAGGRLADLIAEHDTPIGLASLKLFRGQPCHLRFDGNGVCLALDAPAGERSLALFAALDRLTEDVGGVVNVAKDSRLDAAFLRRVFPGYEGFKGALHAHDPKRRLDSALRRRLDV